MVWRPMHVLGQDSEELVAKSAATLACHVVIVGARVDRRQDEQLRAELC
jgi:hypothetical protein